MSMPTKEVQPRVQQGAQVRPELSNRAEQITALYRKADFILNGSLEQFVTEKEHILNIKCPTGPAIIKFSIEKKWWVDSDDNKEFIYYAIHLTFDPSFQDFDSKMSVWKTDILRKMKPDMHVVPNSLKKTLDIDDLGSEHLLKILTRLLQFTDEMLIPLVTAINSIKRNDSGYNLTPTQSQSQEAAASRMPASMSRQASTSSLALTEIQDEAEEKRNEEEARMERAPAAKMSKTTSAHR